MLFALAVQAGPFGLPGYQDFPLHVLLAAIAFLFLRKTIFQLGKMALGLLFLVFLVIAFFKVMNWLNYLFPLGPWWCVVIAIAIVGIVLFPALFQAGAVTFATIRFFYRLVVSIFSSFKTPNTSSSESKQNSSSTKTRYEEAKCQESSKERDDPYSILGVRKGASKTELRSAYIHMLKNNHPDKVANLDPAFQQFANERAKRIQSAYETLKCVV